MATLDPVYWLSAKQLGEAIAAKAVSAREVIEVHLDRIAAVNGVLNAVVQLGAEAARKEADTADSDMTRGYVRGPLHGVPFTVKDTLDVAGLATTAGTQGRKDFIASTDATAVNRLRSAGAIVLGKTNVPEMAAAIETDNLIYGRTNNPFDLNRSPGGSSGGDAAIIAAGGSPLSVGTDAGGSIRIPAHFCGLAALKPTAGRVPRTGQFPPPLGARNALFHVSLISRHVEDLELALSIAAGADGRDHSVMPVPLRRSMDVALGDLKIAYFDDDGGSTPTPEITAAVQEAAKAIASAGAAVKHDRPAAVIQAGKIYHDISRGDGGDGVKAFLNAIGTNSFSPLFEQSLAVAMSPRMASITEALFAFTRWDVFRNEITAALSPYDAVLSPIAPFTALLHGRGFEEESVRGIGYCQIHNLTGWPAVVVRVGTSREGLPIGVQIAARPWREDVALALAKRLEDVFGGWKLAHHAAGPAAELVNPNVSALAARA